jgi:cyclopropane fatty-acyl-phospholipid synthase-like methyltransferase
LTSEARYRGSEYFADHPDWHAADSAWKACRVVEALTTDIRSVCEVGCGAGAILRALHDEMPAARFVGYEIAPDALRLAEPLTTDRLEFRLGNAAEDPEYFDLMLLMDVIEHVSDPVAFLAELRPKAAMVILHIPLDLSAQSVVRPRKLLERRRDSGHIHYFTPETAIATVEDAGYKVASSRLTKAFERPQPSIKARIANVPRRWLPAHVVVRVLGGYSLLVTARPAEGVLGGSTSRTAGLAP